MLFFHSSREEGKASEMAWECREGHEGLGIHALRNLFMCIFFVCVFTNSPYLKAGLWNWGSEPYPLSRTLVQRAKKIASCQTRGGSVNIWTTLAVSRSGNFATTTWSLPHWELWRPHLACCLETKGGQCVNAAIPPLNWLQVLHFIHLVV